MARRLLAAILALALGTAQGAEWTVEGRVVGVSDGDTITVFDHAKVQHKIRLSGIDAPEKGQAFGNASKESLSRLAFDKSVAAHCHKKDRYGREVRRPSDQSTAAAISSASAAPSPAGRP